MYETAKSLEQPVLFIEYTGDQIVFPADAERIHATIPSSDMSRHRFSGDHHGQPMVAGQEAGRVAAGRTIREWMSERFPRG